MSRTKCLDGRWHKPPQQFYEIIEKNFILLALQYAHEADPDAELYYNDYNMHTEGANEKQ